MGDKPPLALAYSRRIREFVEQWKQAHPDTIVTYCDIGRNSIPHVTEAWIAAAFTSPEHRIQITPFLKLFQDDWGIFCANSIGTHKGEPYDGNEAYFLRVQGNQIIEYREYIGDIVG